MNYVEIDFKLNTKSFEKQIEEVEKELEVIAKILSDERTAKFLNKEQIEEYKIKAEKLINKLIILKKKQDDINKEGFKNVSQSIENIVKKVGKWALAIFGIRSAYSAVRSAMSTLSQYDEQMATNIEYIRYVLANALKPIIETIINLAYKLLVYINYISQAWFGVNLFANASAKAFKNANNNIKGANKSAKELQKTLTGFDEMNILQKNGSTVLGGGGGGVMPSFGNVEIPGWIDWIANNKSTILNALKEIALLIGSAFAISKILEFASGIKTVSTLLKSLSSLQIFGLMAGIGVTLYGIVDLVSSLIDGTSTLGSVMFDLGLILDGVGVALISLNASNPIGWITLLAGAVTTLIGAFTDNEKTIKSVADAQKDLNKAQEAYIKASKEHLNAYENKEKAEQNLKKIAKDLKISEDDLRKTGRKLYEDIADGTVDVSNLTEKQKLLLNTYLEELDANAKLTSSTKKLKEARVEEIEQNLELQRSNAFTSKSFDEYGKSVANAYEKGQISALEASSRIYEVLETMDKKTRQTFVDKLPDSVKRGMEELKNNLGSLSKGLPEVKIKVGVDTSSLTKSINNVFNNIASTIGSINISAKSGKKGAKGLMYYSSNIPRLAVGGIINNPGAGVPYRNSIIGERGAEAVVPLTDSQQMALLGEAIGKYININATVPVYVGNRQIAKEIKKINAESDFAYNR